MRDEVLFWGFVLGVAAWAVLIGAGWASWRLIAR